MQFLQPLVSVPHNGNIGLTYASNAGVAIIHSAVAASSLYVSSLLCQNCNTPGVPFLPFVLAQ